MRFPCFYPEPLFPLSLLYLFFLFFSHVFPAFFLSSFSSFFSLFFRVFFFVCLPFHAFSPLLFSPLSLSLSLHPSLCRNNSLSLFLSLCLRSKGNDLSPSVFLPLSVCLSPFLNSYRHAWILSNLRKTKREGEGGELFTLVLLKKEEERKKFFFVCCKILLKKKS